MFSLVCLMLLSGVVEGPSTLPAEKSAIFVVKKDAAGTDYAWSVSPSKVTVGGEPFDLMSMQSDVGDRTQFALFDLPAGQYTIVFVSFDKRIVDPFTVVVGKKKPDDGGEDDSKPDPSKLNAVAKLSYSALDLLSISVAQKLSDVKALSANYKTISHSLTALGMTADKAQDKLAELNEAAVGPRVAHWADWSPHVQQAIQRGMENGDYESDEAGLGAAYLHVSQGLDFYVSNVKE